MNELKSTSIKNNWNLIVPIVCDDMFEYVLPKKEPLSYKDYVKQCVQKYDNVDDKEKDILDNIDTNYYYGISLWEDCGREKIHNYLYRKISDDVKDGKIRLNKHVKDFLIANKYPLIITTLGFNVIEQCLSDAGVVYGDRWYRCKNRNDLPLKIEPGSGIVYHIFGGNELNNWVYNEDTLLHFMHSLNSEDYAAKSIANYIHGQGKRLFVIGSILPDWLFRFLVFPISKCEIGQGYWISRDAVDCGLDLFLSSKYFQGKTNTNEQTICSILHEAKKENVESWEIRPKPKVFISYKRPSSNESEKIKVLNNILKILREQGYEVWTDTENVSTSGTKYWYDIKNMIYECDIFVPIVTDSYIKEFESVVDLDKFSVSYPWRDVDIESKNLNDYDCFDDKLKHPVVREAYYAIASLKVSKKKKFVAPIVVCEQGGLNSGVVEAKVKEDNQINLPRSIFANTTFSEHYDNQPQFFNFPEID